MQDMTDKEAVVVLAKVRDCRTKECDYNCENCELDYTTEEVVKAVNVAIGACLERGKE